MQLFSGHNIVYVGGGRVLLFCAELCAYFLSVDGSLTRPWGSMIKIHWKQEKEKTTVKTAQTIIINEKRKITTTTYKLHHCLMIERFSEWSRCRAIIPRTTHAGLERTDPSSMVLANEFRPTALRTINIDFPFVSTATDRNLVAGVVHYPPYLHER